MPRKADLEANLEQIIKTKWDKRDGRVVPESDDSVKFIHERAAELKEYGWNVQAEWDNKPNPTCSRSRSAKLACVGGGRRPGTHVRATRTVAQRQSADGGSRDIPGAVEAVDMGKRIAVRDEFNALMRRVVAGIVPRVPNFKECRYCKARSYCPERITRDPEAAHEAAWFDDRRSSCARPKTETPCT
jgi:hypothetical protein